VVLLARWLERGDTVSLRLSGSQKIVQRSRSIGSLGVKHSLHAPPHNLLSSAKSLSKFFEAEPPRLNPIHTLQAALQHVPQLVTCPTLRPATAPGVTRCN